MGAAAVTVLGSAGFTSASDGACADNSGMLLHAGKASRASQSISGKM
jgi:hypothetical protein